MKILLTGASGFLGGIIAQQLYKHDVIRLPQSSAGARVDLSKEVPNLPVLDLVIHCAGKAHMVPRTELECNTFIDVNVHGTKNLLTGLDNIAQHIKGFVFISSVSVYGRSTGVMINENATLMANDPYGLSKIQAEGLINEWCQNNNIKCAILRLPLVVGPNPRGNLRSMINGIKAGFYFNIGGGQAKKSVVLAEDVASIVLKAAEVGGIYNLTDGYHPSVREMSELIAGQLNKRESISIPSWLAGILAKTGDLIGKKAPLNSIKLKKLSSDLTFDDKKARVFLGWSPNEVLTNFKLKQD